MKTIQILHNGVNFLLNVDGRTIAYSAKFDDTIKICLMANIEVCITTGEPFVVIGDGNTGRAAK